MPTTQIPEQVERVRDPIRSHMPNNIGVATQESMDAHQGKRSSPLQSQVDSVQLKLKDSTTLSDVDMLVVAESSAAGSSSSRGAKDQKRTILPLPDLTEKDSGATSESRKPKSPEQRERRKERRRRAQQVRRMMKSDRGNSEPTPRVFMQWEKSEVRDLLYKQELKLKSAHEAELRRQLQKQAALLNRRHRDEVQKQASRIIERYLMQTFSNPWAVV